MKITRIVAAAIACTAIYAKIPDTKVLGRPHEKVPATWEACHVFCLSRIKGQDRLYTTSPSEYQKVRAESRTVEKFGLGIPVLGAGALVAAVSSLRYESWQGDLWNDEGTRGYVYNDNYDERYMGPVYRLFKGHHLYTMNEAEKKNITDNHGWTDEGILGYLVKPDKIDAFRKEYGIETQKPWYRLFAADDHFYTTDADEAQRALKTGHQDEGIMGYLY